MTTDDSFVDLKHRLRRGDPTAGEEVFHRYGQQLIRLVSPRLVGLLRRKVDAEDLVQSAFRSFFRAAPADPHESAGRFPGSWNELWALLVTITLRKCRYQVRHFLTAKRDLAREHGAPPDGHAWHLVAAGPGPAEVAECVDTLHALLTALDDRGRAIAELALQDYSPVEIATTVRLTERTVYRQLARIRARLEALDARQELAS